jgi:hypothetical protein
MSNNNSNKNSNICFKTWQEYKPFIFSPGDKYLEEAFNLLTQKGLPFLPLDLQKEAARLQNNELFDFLQSCENTQDSEY